MSSISSALASSTSELAAIEKSLGIAGPASAQTDVLSAGSGGVSSGNSGTVGGSIGVSLGTALGSATSPLSAIGAAFQNLFTSFGNFFGVTPTGTSAITSQFLRLILLILGLICIAGAIYLYKPSGSNPVGVIVEGARKGAQKGISIVKSVAGDAE